MKSLAKSLHDFKLQDAQGKKLDLAQFKGKVVLLSNIATQCGFTPQLDGLEELHDAYKDKGLVVIGVPSNDFGGQNPQNGQETAEFCRLNYKTEFLTTEKINVKGKSRHQLFDYIASERPGLNVMWNFEKFIFDKDGKLVESFRSTTKPRSKKVTSLIEKLIK